MSTSSVVTGIYYRLKCTPVVILRSLGTTVAKASVEVGHDRWYLDLEVVPGGAVALAQEDSSIGVYLQDAGLDAAVIGLLETLVEKTHASNGILKIECGYVLRVVFSGEPGTIVRPDFLRYRLHGCEDITLAQGFLQPLSAVTAIDPGQATSIKTSHDFTRLLRSAIGGIIAHTTSQGDRIEELRTRLDWEFARRLSVPWTVDVQLTQRRVFWVQGRANIEASRQFYEAASALGITLVVLDEPGHWLQDDAGPHAHYREAFIPISIDGDAGLTERIVEAVRGYPHKVDGLVCISDVRLPLVARACEILGLPTSTSAAFVLAGNKGASREVESAAAGDENENDGFVIKTPGDLDAALSKRQDQLHYPLIVKPCTGWNSDCVVKVRDENELRAAVRRASERHATWPVESTSVVVEAYVDGPEIDANFIMLDGEVLFCDITDDFPCSGDGPGTESAGAANFMETLMDVPSALPVDERAMMRESLRKSIARLGFQSGVFHCEARVRDSRAHYAVDPGSGMLDLHISERATQDPLLTGLSPSCFLHEVNARPPGYINCVAALLAHGVDYYAILLLLSLGSREDARVRVLARPFRHGEPQYVLGIVVLPPTRPGIMGSDDAVVEFLETHTPMRRHVVHSQTIKKRGDVVQGPDSSELWCVGYVTVASREGRRACLDLVRQVREKFEYRLVDE